jgi:hypothetical protein
VPSTPPLDPATSTLLASGQGSLVDPRFADVGRSREELRRRRLLWLLAIVGTPTAYLWYRIADGRPFNVLAIPDINWLVLTPILFFVLLIALLGGMHWGTGRSPHVIVRPEQIDVRLSDVVGIDVVKDEVVRSLNLFLAHQTFAREMGGRPRRGLLFEGGPGTGKTHTAKAMAAEAGVPFLYASATSFQSSYQAATSRKVRAYFRALRTAARKEGGAIGFIDEFDAIAAARSGMAMSSAPASAMSGPTCCGGLEGLPGAPVRSLAGGSSVTTAFVGGGDLQAAVNELLVQMQSFDEGSAERATDRQDRVGGEPLPAGPPADRPASEPARQRARHRRDQPSRRAGPGSAAPGPLRPAPDLRPAGEGSPAASSSTTSSSARRTVRTSRATSAATRWPR